MSNWVPQSKTQCVLKWGWSTIQLFNGARTKSCYKNPPIPLTKDSFYDFHNLETLKLDREKMLNGEWPEGCFTCKNVEDVGGISDRITNNKFQHLVPQSLINTPSSTISNPTVVEVYFRNTCNMSCIYCTPILSSKFASEIKNFGEYEHGDVVIKNKHYDETNYKELLETFWVWLEKNIKNIRELNILGGEPFLLPELKSLISFIHNNTAPDLDLTIISNLNIEHELFKNIANELVELHNSNKIKSIKINASIDGWDKSIEFQRYGLSMDLFEKNFTWLLNETNLRLCLNFTATCIGIPSMPKLIEKWAEWNKIRYVDLSGMQVETKLQHQEYLDLDTFPSDFLLPYLKKSLDYFDKMAYYDSWQKENIENLKIYIEKRNSIGDVNKINNLKIYLNEISRRRNIKWQDYYPWLESFFNEHLVY